MNMDEERRRGERGTACGATGGVADAPGAPIDGADESEVAQVRAVIVEVDVEAVAIVARNHCHSTVSRLSSSESELCESDDSR